MLYNLIIVYIVCRAIEMYSIFILKCMQGVSSVSVTCILLLGRAIECKND